MVVKNFPAMKRVSNKRKAIRTCHVVEEYAEVRIFVRAGSSKIMVAEAHRQFTKYCTMMDGLGNKGGNDNQGGSDSFSIRFQSQFRAIKLYRANIGEAAPSTLENVLKLALGDLRVVAFRLKECQDATDNTYLRA